MIWQNIEEILQSNVKKEGGHYILKFIYGPLPHEFDNYITIPFQGQLNILSPLRTNRSGKLSTPYLKLPQAAFRKLLSDMEESDFRITSISMQKSRDEYFRMNNCAQVELSFNNVVSLLENGYQFSQCVFTREDDIFGVNSQSQIWSSQKSLVSVMGNTLAKYTMEIIGSLEKFLNVDSYGTESTISHNTIKYGVNNDTISTFLDRVGRKRINIIRKGPGKNTSTIFWTHSRRSIINVYFTGDIGYILSLPNTDINTLIETAEIMESSGGIYIG